MARIPATRVSVGFVLLLSALTAIGPLTFDTYLAAFPQIAEDLDAPAAAVQLTIAASLAGPRARSAAHRLDLRRVRSSTPAARSRSSVYVLASVGDHAGRRTSRAFTALRFVQGFTAAAGMVLSMAIVRDRYEGLAVSKVHGPAHARRRRRPDPRARPSARSCSLFGSWRLIFVFLAAIGAIAAGRRRGSPCASRCPPSGAAPAGPAPRCAPTATCSPTCRSSAWRSCPRSTCRPMFTYVASSTFVFQDGYGLVAAAVRLGVRRRRGRDHRRVAGQRRARRAVPPGADPVRGRRRRRWCSASRSSRRRSWALRSGPSRSCSCSPSAPPASSCRPPRPSRWRRTRTAPGRPRRCSVRCSSGSVRSSLR